MAASRPSVLVIEDDDGIGEPAQRPAIPEGRGSSVAAA